MVEGGDVLDERLRSARETAKRPVAGFCLDGFQTGAMDLALRNQLMAAVVEELPEDKPRSGPLTGEVTPKSSANTSNSASRIKRKKSIIPNVETINNYSSNCGVQTKLI